MESTPLLLEQIQACQDDFGATLSKSFYVALVNLLVQKKTAPQRAHLERTVASFSEHAHKKLLSPHLRAMLELRTVDGQGGCEAIQPESLDPISQKTLEGIRDLVREQALAYASLCSAQTPAARDADMTAKGFAAQARALLALFNDKILELLGATCALTDEAGALEASGANGRVGGHLIRDFVGRILFIPLEKYVSIVDYDEKFDVRRKLFPRCFCAPVLHILRPLVIGREKYLYLNEALKTGISKILGEEVPLSTENSIQFLHGEKIYKHIMSLTLHILNVYRDEELREMFLEKVNDDLRRRFPHIPLEFNDRFCAILFKCWARFTYDHTPDFTNMKKAESILRHHIPEMFKPEDDAWVR